MCSIYEIKGQSYFPTLLHALLHKTCWDSPLFVDCLRVLYPIMHANIVGYTLLLLWCIKRAHRVTCPTVVWNLSLLSFVNYRYIMMCIQCGPIPTWAYWLLYFYWLTFCAISLWLCLKELVTLQHGVFYYGREASAGCNLWNFSMGLQHLRKLHIIHTFMHKLTPYITRK